ncbi:MAG: hypothetical protein ABF276_00500 [Sulfurovum sp.]
MQFDEETYAHSSELYKDEGIYDLSILYERLTMDTTGIFWRGHK